MLSIRCGWQDLIFDHDSASVIYYSSLVVSFICASSSSLSVTGKATGYSSTHPVLCIEENSQSLGLGHQPNEKRQESWQKHLWLCATKSVALGLAVIFQENANVDFNYFNFLSFALTSLSEICCRQGPRRMGAQSFWNSVRPPNGRHDLDIQETGVKYPKAKRMPASAV